jgi:hypothetical protein
MRTKWLVSLAAICSLGVAALANAQAKGSETEPTRITFFVFERQPTGPIVGRARVEAVRIGRDGAATLGRTNSEGEVVIDTVNIFTPEGIALLFCDPVLPARCAAVRVDTDLLRGFAEYNIEFPNALTLIDRRRVTPGKEPSKR